jgi:hypothetical protein
MVSLRISIRLLSRSEFDIDKPVTLPPGRASDVTIPLAMASPTIAKTIGAGVRVAVSAWTACGPAVTMTS